MIVTEGMTLQDLVAGLNAALTADGQQITMAIAADGSLTATNAGGVAANYIAKWDGAAWTNLGSGMNASVNALAYDLNGNLYAGGAFTNAGGVAANRVAKWDGTSWFPIGRGLNGAVKALGVDGSGNVYACGPFSATGGRLSYHFAWWR